MEWFIMGRDMHVLCNPSTDAPKSLQIYDDKQTNVISNNTVVSTYDFTISKQHKDATKVQLGGYIVFVDKYRKTKMYTLMSYDGDDITQTWHAEDIGLDLLNESSEKWTEKEPHPIAWYLENRVIGDSGWTIGINEIPQLSRTLSFDGESDTQLTRLGDIANQFDGAEIDFSIEMRGSQVTQQHVNIYKKIGSNVIQDRYVDSVNLISLHSTGTIESLTTALKPFGSEMEVPEGSPEGTEASRVTLYNVKYDDGRYYSPWGHVYLYDRQARQQWSRFNQYNSATAGEFDGYIVGSYSYDTLDENELLKHALTQLKKQNTPQETFEAQLSDINADIGDYVQIAHSEYNPPLYLKARVEQVENSYTQDGADTGVLGDYTHLQSQIDPRVKDLLNDLENKMKFNYTWIRYASDDKGSDMTSFPTADTKYIAIIPNKQSGVPSDDPKDYEGKWQLIAGIDGKDGVAGEKGADGRTSYTHFAYANDVSGTTDFSLDDPTGRAYMGVLSDFIKADSTNPDDYIWSLTKGEDGLDGVQGIPGKPGIDGKTPYTHVAYADNDEGGGFSQSPDNKAYMGWYSDFTQADSNDPSLYGWSLIKGADGKDGADGVAGKDGVGVKTTTITYTQSTNGTTPPASSWTASVPTLIKGQYLWTRTVWTYTDSATETGYTVSYNAKDGNSGTDGRAGKDGVGIKTTTITYQSGTSGTVQPTGTWVSSPPSVTGGNYLWTRTVWIYTDGTNETGYSVAKMGEKGDAGAQGLQGLQGPRGNQGIQGPKGPDGKSSYTHIAYANIKFLCKENQNFTLSKTSLVRYGSDSRWVYKELQVGTYTATTTLWGQGDPAQGVTKNAELVSEFSTSDYVDKTHIGVYVDFVEADSGDPSKYAWSLIKGADGTNGTPGKAGTDGKTPYFHTAWATSADGRAGFSTTDSTNKSYLGTYTDFTVADSTDTTKYAWSLIKGRDGVNGANGAPGKPGADGRTPYFHQAWADSKDGKVNFSATDPSNRGYLGTYSDFTQADSTDPSKYFWTELVGNLQVGVRNLLKGTADFSNGLNVSGANGMVITDEVYNGNRVVKEPQLTASNSYHDPYVSNTIDVAKGEYYALSFYAKTDAPSMVMRCYFYNPTNTISSINNQGFKSTSSDGLSTFTITNQWKQYWIVWRTNINTTVKRVIIGRREKSLAGSDTGAIFINSPMLVEGNKAVGWQAAPEDTQQQIDTINKGLADTNGKIAAVPHVSAQAGAPTNPKKGDQWWVLDAQGKATGFKVWNGTAWADSKIQQSMLNVVSLNAVTITGSTINGSKFTNNFDFTDLSKVHFQGVTEIANGSHKTDFKIAGSNQVGHVYVQPDGFHTYMSGLNGDVNTSLSIDLAFDAISLANGSTSGTLNAADIERTDREVWDTTDPVNGIQHMGLSKQFRRVWLDGSILLTGASGNPILKLKNPKLYPKRDVYLTLGGLGDINIEAQIHINPYGNFWAMSVSNPNKRYICEGAYYMLDF